MGDLATRSSEQAKALGRHGIVPIDRKAQTVGIQGVGGGVWFRRALTPIPPDAWVDEAKTVVGYEIPLTRYFYKYVEPRALEDIDAEIDEVEQEILRLLATIRT